MRVPNKDNAVVDAMKLKGYLLSPTHPVGRFKARYFAALGYDAANWETLGVDLRSLLDSDVVHTAEVEFGVKFVVRGNITSPNGSHVNITTVWIVLTGEEIPRLVTAYPES